MQHIGIGLILPSEKVSLKAVTITISEETIKTLLAKTTYADSSDINREELDVEMLMTCREFLRSVIQVGSTECDSTFIESLGIQVFKGNQ